MLKLLVTAALVLGAFGPQGCLFAQWWDAGAMAGEAIRENTSGKLAVSLEFRTRVEDRRGNAFGKDPDLDYGLARTRLGLSYTPVSWLKLSGMLQDSRSPGYGPNAPSTVRDPADLQEAYFEIRPGAKAGFSASAGRRMVVYGEGRLLGVPQWSNLARTYDFGRAAYQTGKVKLEWLVVSPVKIRLEEFNRPVMGERVWGTYNTFGSVLRKSSVDAYFLRRNQNRPGGFASGNRVAGTDKLNVNTWGFRLYGPLSESWQYSMEGMLQAGKVGVAEQRGGAWFSSVTRRWILAGRTLDLSGEYKYASGNKDPKDASHTGTFDQLYAANHDRFGHEDLFGWKNLHDARSLATFGISKAFSINAMYNNLWLASARDALYSGAGKSLAQSVNGTAGRHVGQEADVFATCKVGHWLVGAGYGYFAAGNFLRRTTPGTGPTYLYIFQTYSFQ